MQQQRNYNHLLHTIDVMIEDAVSDVKQTGKKISCTKGCSHCCYLLVEISWEEALLMAEWLKAQRPKTQEKLIANIHENARLAREVFSSYKSTQKFIKPFHGDLKMPERVYGKYFYHYEIPCAFLVDGACAAYEVRPTPCRLHMVTSPATLCSRNEPDDVEGYEIPDRLEQVKEDIVPITSAFYKDGRWGQLGVMVKAALTYLEKEHQNK